MDFVAASFGVFLVTHLLTNKAGAFNVLSKLRAKLEALQCFDCTSVYVAALFAALTAHTLTDWFIHATAYAGAAVLLDRLGNL